MNVHVRRCVLISCEYFYEADRILKSLTEFVSSSAHVLFGIILNV